METFLLLTLGCDPHPDFIQSIGGSTFIFTGNLDSRFALVARGPARVESTRRFGYAGLEFTQTRKTAANRFLN